MEHGEYMAPEFHKEAFHCPACNVYANQTWSIGVDAVQRGAFQSGSFEVSGALWVARCAHCSKNSFWTNGELIYPPKITAPLAHKEMPETVAEYYNEAREVSVSSSRAAAALLRIAAKKLCEELGESEYNLNRAIGNLSKKGLPQDVIKLLDAVRIVGNEGGAHEGQIDLTGQDSKEIVDKLFWLINFIVEKMINEPQEIENTFQSLPSDKKQGVEQRDKKDDAPHQ